MTDFNPDTPLLMARRKSVNGTYLNAGTKLVITDKPSAPGEVDEDTARLLFNKGIAVPLDDFRPTPVETKDQEAARLRRDQVATDAEMPQTSASTSDSDGEKRDSFEPQSDLVTWQADDDEAGKKAGDPVTNDDLVLLGGREGLTFSGDRKADMQLAIMNARAARAEAEG